MKILIKMIQIVKEKISDRKDFRYILKDGKLSPMITITCFAD